MGFSKNILVPELVVGFASICACVAACLMCYSPYFLPADDSPIDIVTPLKQTEGFEQQCATMSCELSRCTTQAKWLKGNEILEESEKYVMSWDGRMCRLTVVNLNFDDEAEYSLIVDDKRTSAFLLVEGMYSRLESDIDDSDVSESQGSIY